MGAGGVGGHYGALLARAAHDVTFVARGAHLTALQAHGLELHIGQERFHLNPVRAVESPGELGSADSIDLVLFTVKTYDTAAAIEALRPAVGPDTAVLTLQNGVDSTQDLAAAFGPHRVIAGTTVMTSIVTAPGVIEAAPGRTMVLAELSGTPTPRLSRVAAAFQDVGVDVTVVRDARVAVWEKFVLLAALATLTSACGLSVGSIRDAPETSALLRGLIAEAARVGRACGVSLPVDVEEAAWTKIGAAPGWARTSMQVDFEARHRAELEELTGTAVRLAREHSVPTPLFDVLYALLKVRLRALAVCST
jgi:2-dehydropantoate 2-reductase